MGPLYRGHTVTCALPMRGGACDCGPAHGVSPLASVTTSSSFNGMAKTSPRRPRGSLTESAVVYAKMQTEYHAKAKAMAAAHGMTVGAFVEEMVKRVQVDESGRAWSEDDLLNFAENNAEKTEGAVVDDGQELRLAG